MRPIDTIHLALMCAAAVIAYAVPFELLLLSYVVLGPAHYLTEISWLHDRKYFLPHPSLPIVLALVAIVAAFITDGVWFGVVIWGSLVLCALFASTTGTQCMVVAMVAAALTLGMAARESTFVLLGTLVPTVIHVSVFTVVFMLVGAHRSGLKAHVLLVGAYLAAIALILAVPPSAATVIPAFAQAARDYFEGVAPALGRVFGVPALALDGRMSGLLAFVYTYHYLNWFIKADVVRWAAVPKPRLALVALASTGATALYFYDYGLGFTVLLGLSLVHVLLEFPLNIIAVRQLGTIAVEAVRPRLPTRARAGRPSGATKPPLARVARRNRVVE